MRHVLVVDDDPVTTGLLAGYLQAAGFKPLVAEDGLEAVKIFLDRRPRIVVSDWIMPKMDGMDLCRAIKSHETDRFVYMIMLTVRSDKARLMEALDAGVDDYLCKPFDKGELLARIRVGVRTIGLYDKLADGARRLSRVNGELSRLNTKLRRMAATDELTGLYNRRQAMARLEELWALAERYHHPLACAMIDIDRFKRINDTYGHAKGDEVLQKIAGVLLKSVRISDTVCRIGGEEFLILFPYQEASQAAVCAERCRAAVESCSFNCLDEGDSLTISIGVADRSDEMTEAGDLLKATDRSMYAAKKLGRNTVMADTAA